MSLTPRWHAPAEQDLLRIPWRDAAWISSAVNDLAEHGTGDVRRVVLSTGERVFYLFLSGYRVVVTFDRPNSVVHVWRVFRTGRP